MAPIRFPRCGSPVGLTPVNETFAAGCDTPVILLAPAAAAGADLRNHERDNDETPTVECTRQ